MRLNNQSLVNAIKRLVTENPNYVYENTTEPEYDCVYVEKTADGDLVGSCLLGRALISLGMDAAELHTHEGEDFRLLAEVMDLPLSESVVRWADGLQTLQDEGFAWGELFDRARVPTPLFKEPIKSTFDGENK